MLVLDLDSSLDLPAVGPLNDLRERLQEDAFAQSSGLVILSGRSLTLARQRYAELHLPDPDVWISSAGTELHHGPGLELDQGWMQRINQCWSRQSVLKAMEDLQDHITLQDSDHQGAYKVSYLLKEADPGLLSLARQRLRRDGLQAQPHLRCHWFLDVLPQRASRSEAIRFLAMSWGLSFEQVMVVASQQGDAELMDGLPATVVPADHDRSLQVPHHQPRVYVSKRSSVSAVLDGLTHYHFLSTR
jgi:sucrose-phosphate synthase